tara:strand:+ start:58 stop:321 length:264 start_codon:yes stop_codon:yes gene_type:complete
MTKKLNDKIKGISIGLDKSTQLKELNGVIDEFKKETDDRHEVKVSLTFETSQSTLHLNRIRKPFLILVTKDGKVIKKDKKNLFNKKK